MNKRYKVWFSRGNIFDTLEMATKYANLVYSRTGLIVAMLDNNVHIPLAAEMMLMSGRSVAGYKEQVQRGH